MRLHRLTLAAFGSFRERATIDFDELSDPGIFLLHGPTGAGKTTILDAVSFALFGTVPGARRAGESLRSHHAPGDAVTEVELEVTLDGRRYRIVRRPKQHRPKQRGEGTREHPAQATVEELVAGAWVGRASKPNEADPYLQEHLHMEADQFHQIVLLPQGDFARFLRASADERRTALEELFGTHRFTEVERWLRAQADAARQARDAAAELARRVLATAAAVADADPFDDDAPLADAASWLSELIDEAVETADAADQREQAARVIHRRARAELQRAVERDDRQQRHAAAAANRALLADAHGDHTSRLARRDAAARAAPVEPLLDAVSRASQTHERASLRSRDAIGVLDRIAPEWVGEPLDVLANQHEHMIGRLAGLTDLIDLEDALAERELRLHDLAERCTSLDEQRAQLERARAALPAERARLAQQVASAQESAGRLDDLTRIEAQLAARHEAAVERDRLIVLAEACTAELATVRGHALDTREHWLGLVEQLLASRAATLATGLEPGDACPVCGSPDHPALASADGSIVTDDEVAAALERTEEADRALQLTTDAAAALHQQLAAAVATAGEGETAALHAELGRRRDELAAASAEAATVTDLAEALAQLDQRAEAIDQLLADAEREQAAVGHEHTRLDTAVEADRAQLREARAGFPSLAERAESLQATRDALATVIDAELALGRAADALDDASTAAEVEAVRRGFTDVGEARRSRLDDQELADLVERIDQYERSLAEADVLLRDPDLVDAAAADPVDLDQVELSAHVAERDWDLASTTAAGARALVHKLEAARAELDERLVALVPLTEAYERTRALADLAGGDDRRVEHRMRLSTYVLAARLEQVAAAASERLSRMSGGRYTIVHTDEAPDGRRKGGLGLRVVDAWTSTHRETTSLSGGESFFTSLALALGVADVVSAEAGGITIDTMFIDEGFGSLDDDTLQQVLDVIDGLRAGGRTVGIVSHVADLRDRITTQLEVIKGPEGSTLRTSAAAPRPAPAARTELPALALEDDAA